MGIKLKKANIQNSNEIHEMQIIAFEPLLEKYRDYETNPGAETFERVKQRFNFDTVDHYFISLHDKNIGYIRIQCLDDNVYKLSQMFILPGYQGNGHAQTAISKASHYTLVPQNGYCIQLNKSQNYATSMKKWGIN